MDYKKAIQIFSNVEAKETFNNFFANSLLVMLNYIRSTITECENSELKKDLKNIFIKYTGVLQNEIKK